jgi:glucan phosphoethanolaminetransferase (alkaline phosphatase superfamily)
VDFEKIIHDLIDPKKMDMIQFSYNDILKCYEVIINKRKYNLTNIFQHMDGRHLTFAKRVKDVYADLTNKRMGVPHSALESITECAKYYKTIQYTDWQICNI